jgi:hypothetical protein
MTCPLCGSRKGRRSCPALRSWICAGCCGSKRRVEVDCPADCAFLTGRAAGAWEGRATELRRDKRRIGSLFASMSEAQENAAYDVLIGLQEVRSRYPDVDDRLMASALGVLRQTLETQERGILYEHKADDLRVQLVTTAIQESIEPDDERKAHRPSVLLAVVRAFEQGLARAANEETDPRAFLDSARRVAELLDRGKHDHHERESARIILPGE